MLPRMSHRKLMLCSSIATALAVSCAFAQQQKLEEDRTTSNVVRPAIVEATPERMAALKVPDGFSVQPFATGLKNVRVLVVAPDGTVYASRRDQGDVVMLKDADGDGRADGAPAEVAHRAGVHGLALHDGKLYMATVKELFVADIQPDGTLRTPKMLLGDLPDGGQHANRTLAFGPDGMLYLSVGSTCNACNEPNPENATLLRVKPDGTSRTIFASGLRNTIGFGWQPRTGELWGMDHGIDALGDDQQPEELNKLEHGKRYGWPHVYGDGALNPTSAPPPGGMTREQWRAISAPMALGYTAHAAPMQLAFVAGDALPRDYDGDAIVAMRGSWNRRQPSGYEVVRVDFENGRPTRISPFLTGFLVDGGRAAFGRPVGIAQARDGALLVGDDSNGVIYRVAYTKGGRAVAATDGAGAAMAPAGPMEQQARQGVGVPLALERAETAGATKTLDVTSPSIKHNAPIPQRHSEYYDGVSPALSWTAVEGAKSYAIVMEDPDAKPITPFVHWVAWNIPAALHALPEGLQEQMRLTDPEGLMQGRTSRGNTGYLGPRPPVGDPPHHYHVQLLALDTLLQLPPGADRDQLLAAARGHVLAKGELVGTYQQKVKPPK